MVDVPGMWLFASLMGYLYSQVTEPIGSLIVLWSYKGMLYSYRRGLCIACSTVYGNAKAKMCGIGKWSVPALFYAVTWSFVLYPSCRGTQDTWKTLGDGNILFFIEYGYLLYLLWHYYYGGDNGYSIFHLEVFEPGYCKIYTFLYNRCDTCILADM